jgi:hypothetical protein
LVGAEALKNKLAIGIALLTLAIAIIGSGVVYSYFSDIQTADNNAFIAGALTVSLAGNGIYGIPVNIGGPGSIAQQLKPGDTGTAAYWTLANTGTINGDLNISIGPIQNNENITNRPKLAAGAYNGPDNSWGAGRTNILGNGLLGSCLQVAIWIDTSCTRNTYEPGKDFYLKPDGSIGHDVPGYYNLDQFANTIWSADTLGLTNKAPGNIANFHMEYSLPASANNSIQGDNSTFSIVFVLQQVSSAASPTPTATPAPAATPTPTATPIPVVIQGAGWETNGAPTSNDGTYFNYTMQVILQVTNTGSQTAQGVLASCVSPPESAGLRNIKLVSAASPDPQDIPRWDSCRYVWTYTFQIRHGYTAIFDLGAIGINTNQVNTTASFTG